MKKCLGRDCCWDRVEGAGGRAGRAAWRRVEKERVGRVLCAEWKREIGGEVARWVWALLEVAGRRGFRRARRRGRERKGGWGVAARATLRIEREREREREREIGIDAGISASSR
eukprot:TRINITY_DN3820_c1_g2_i2.p2 TRINITY_DN3820_c1_g2~~TRINITY_DN3820_c1_g2_i2.p2  ORF type:complete len:114 (+),score=29.24 TRINITY_DN3820_c1_g2_i2:199-540(+)